MKKGDIKKSQKNLDKTLELNPENIDANYTYAYTYLKKENYAQTINYCKRVLAIDPQIDYANYFMALAHKYSGNYDRSVEIFTYLLGKYPYDEEEFNLFENLGELYYLKEDFEKSEEFYQKSIKSFPLNTTSLLGLADIEFEKGNFDRVIDICKNILEIDKNNSDAYTYIGAVYLEKGLFHEAITNYRKSLELYPNCFSPHDYVDKISFYQEKIRECILSIKSSSGICGMERSGMEQIPELVRNILGGAK